MSQTLTVEQELVLLLGEKGDLGIPGSNFRQAYRDKYPGKELVIQGKLKDHLNQFNDTVEWYSPDLAKPNQNLRLKSCPAGNHDGRGSGSRDSGGRGSGGRDSGSSVSADQVATLAEKLASAYEANNTRLTDENTTLKAEIVEHMDEIAELKAKIGALEAENAALNAKNTTEED
jgi:hypothetical protein